MPEKCWLVVGLGNPGTRYAQNRHNIGYMAAEAISAAYSFDGWSKKFHGKVSEGKIPFSLQGEGPAKPGMRGTGGSSELSDAGTMSCPPHPPLRGTLSLQGEGKVILLLPETYMNESGRAVQGACTFHKIAPENVIVLHDEIELAPSKIRIKQGGGHGGHNGLKSIDAAIGPNYWRVRLGIGRPPHPEMEVADFVLSNFSPEEKKWLAPFLKSVAEHFPLLLENQPSELMNRVTLDTKSSQTTESK